MDRKFDSTAVEETKIRTPTTPLFFVIHRRQFYKWNSALFCALGSSGLWAGLGDLPITTLT
jgi:hypothetical protein